ncbi:hypothetical protein F2P56_006393 [Juglans regia]|uniref:Uncharacterized protein n=1 Tax=Juglans regia TaxID=51240 RepID=A0A833Y1D4_JUGRE|nr:hypothetical protein F2P56_006393 [Juglans regia]
MASVLGTSATAILASRPFTSPTPKPSVSTLTLTPGQGNGRKFYGGIGIHSKRGRSQFHVAITNVATDINSAELVLMFLIYAILVSNFGLLLAFPYVHIL